MDELSCVPETQQSQQAAGVEELVVGVVDPLEMLDTEQGDFGLETQHDSDLSDEDTQDTQAAGETQKGKGKRIGPRGRLCGISFMRRTMWIKMTAKGGSRVSTHSSEKSLT